MSLTDSFQDAQKRVTTLSEAPSNDEMLSLYALFKQASKGDADGKRPGMLDFVARAKYDAWATKKGLSTDQAMQAYIDLVNELFRKAGK